MPLELVAEIGKGRQAALKAWETRRRNQMAKKRSEAAKQARETRRANERKRSEAAKQAWRTRRSQA